jgi:hypothetical protein
MFGRKDKSPADEGRRATQLHVAQRRDPQRDRAPAGRRGHRGPRSRDCQLGVGRARAKSKALVEGAEEKLEEAEEKVEERCGRRSVPAIGISGTDAARG